MKNYTAGPLVKILKTNGWRFVHQKHRSLHTPWTAIVELRCTWECTACLENAKWQAPQMNSSFFSRDHGYLWWPWQGFWWVYCVHPWSTSSFCPHMGQEPGMELWSTGLRNSTGHNWSARGMTKCWCYPWSCLFLSQTENSDPLRRL